MKNWFASTEKYTETISKKCFDTIRINGTASATDVAIQRKYMDRTCVLQT